MASTSPPRIDIPHSSGLVREGIWITGLTIGSKVLGILREGLLAWAFGTSAIVDAFRVAQTGTFLLIHIFAGSVLDSAILPTFKHLLATGRRRAAWRIVGLVARTLAVVGIVLSVALALFGRSFASIIAPGFDPGRRTLTVVLLATMALAVPLGFGTNLLTTVSNGLYRFRVPALRALAQNVVVLIGILLAMATGSILWLGFSIPFAQLAMVVLLLVSLRGVPVPRAAGTRRRDSVIWRFAGVAIIPGMGLVLLEQANIVVERIVASHLHQGAIASLDYARFLVETPLVTLGVGITQTLLPTLSDLSATGDTERFRHSIRTLLLACLWALLPVSVYLLSFGEDLIRIIYARGAFGEDSVRTTTAALSGFAIGLWAWFGGQILQRGFYAQRRLGTLLPLTAVSLVGYGVLAIGLAPQLGVRGISMAFSIANIAFFSLGLVALGWGLLVSVLPSLVYFLIGGAFLYIIGPGVVRESSPIVRVVLGAALTGLAWIGWTIMNPSTRRLLFSLIRTLRRSA